MEHSTKGVHVAPGKEDDFRYVRRQLAASAAVDRVIEATEPAYVNSECFDSPESSPPVRVTDKPLSELIDTVQGEEVPEAMWMHEYVAEKTREFEVEELARTPRQRAQAPGPRTVGVFPRLAAGVGKSMQRAGRRLESWATIEDSGGRAGC